MKKMNESDRRIHQQFVRYGTNAKEWMKKCVFLLPEIERRKIWRKKGFSCIYEYAAKIAGMNREKVDDSLRILKRLEDKPILKKVAEERGLSAVRPVLAISDDGEERFWADKARGMSIHTLETYVKDYRKQNEGRNELQSELQGGLQSGLQNEPQNLQIQTCNFRHVTENESEKLVRDNQTKFNDAKNSAKITITMELDPETAEKLTKLKGLGEWEALMNEFISFKEQEFQRQKPEKVETNSRHVPVKIQRYVMAKTNGTCVFPGCKAKAEVLHHTQRFALEKVHDPDKVVALCKAHHAIAHRGLISDENAEATSWQIRRESDFSGAKFWIDQEVVRYGGTRF